MALAAIAFVTATAAGIAGGRRALRILALLVFVLAPLRGALEKVLLEAGAPDPELTVNALAPALVVALAAGVIVVCRPRLAMLPRPILIGWLLTATACLLDLATQAVGLELYLVGLAQYLVYPTYALAVWPLLEPGDLKRLVITFLGAASFLALSVIAQAAGFDGFVQELPSEVGLGIDRYGGATGSALHSSAYLGAAGAVALGAMAVAPAPGALAAAFASFALILSGQTLTYTRSGLLIVVLAALALLALGPAAARRRLGVLFALGLCVGFVAGAAGGVTPSDTFSRLESVLSTSAEEDPENAQRLELVEQALEDFGDAPLDRKLAGEGLAATGNASKLVDRPPRIVESYLAKLLVETGIVGLLLIGGFLVWAGVALVRSVLSSVGTLLPGVGLAAFGLLLYAIFYPTLETQVLACTWWLLLAACIRYSPAISS